MSSSSESSRSPSPVPQKPANKRKSDKGKPLKSKPGVEHTADGKNEGSTAHAHLDYKPPEGFALLDHTGAECEDFDWDTIKEDEDLELWVVRVPEGVKAKHLESLRLDAPQSSRTSRIGSLKRKQGTYDLWSLGTDSSPDAHTPVGGEELRALTCMLPRSKKGGKLYAAPKPIARHLVLCAQPAHPAIDSSLLLQNHPRPSYPDNVLKHRFMPYGSLVQAVDEGAMEVEELEPDLAVEEEETKDNVKKAKKRKGPDVLSSPASPKKSKKPKVAG